MPSFLAFLFKQYGASRIASRVGIRASSLRRIRQGIRPPFQKEINALKRLRREISRNRMARVGIPNRIIRQFRDQSFANQDVAISTFNNIVDVLARDNEIDDVKGRASIRSRLRLTDKDIDELRERYT